MITELITTNIWKRLTEEVKTAKYRSVVAVAYFGKDGARMLPLKKGSILLVDASEKAVKSGQTCPAELLKLYYKGVQIFSKKWLHAKMFVVGNNLFIGSTNVSNMSTRLTEAIIKISDKKSVDKSKIFINSFCKIELGEDQLKRLQKLYREPRFEGPPKGNSKPKSAADCFLFVYHLESVNYDLDEKKQSEIGIEEAQTNRLNKSRHRVDEFIWIGNCMAKKGDTVIQIFYVNNETYVYPPGTVIHQRRWTHSGKKKTLNYIEVPIFRRKNLKIIDSNLSVRERQLLQRNGRKNTVLSKQLLSIWNTYC